MTDTCLLWAGAVSKNGYGITWRNGKAVSAHRAAYEDAKGQIPAGLVVRHKCDVRTCVNPEHLEVGTHADNSRDMVERGRSRGGRPRVWPEATDIEIRRLLALGRSHSDIASALGCSATYVHRIRHNKRDRSRRLG